MTQGTGVHRESHVEYVRVSEGTRNDAKPAVCSDKSYRDMHNELVARTKSIEAELTLCGKAALQKEQARIRRNGDSHQTAAEYNRVKAKLQSKREALIIESKKLQEEIVRLKPLIRREECDRNDEMAIIRADGSLSYSGAALKMIELLENIEVTLRVVAKQQGDMLAKFTAITKEPF